MGAISWSVGLCDNAEVTENTSLSFRSYGVGGVMHRHAHVQFVLPVLGELEIEVGGRGGRLDLARAAFVPEGTDHDQLGRGENRFLVIDCATSDLDEAAVERLSRDPFLTIPAAARRLIEFIDLSRGGDFVPETVTRHGLPLLLGALLAEPERASRLGPLLRRIEAAPGRAWTVERMAAETGMSVSRLHARFRRELDTTPQRWLTDLRLKAVQERLAGSDVSIAELAFQAGYSDQSALTRALRRATGLTPAAYRKAHRR